MIAVIISVTITINVITLMIVPMTIIALTLMPDRCNSGCDNCNAECV